MRKAYSTGLLLLLLAFIGGIYDANAQCGAGTPSYKVDLRGHPDSIWYSPSVARGDTCCSSLNCIEFIVDVDPSVIAIKLDITAGAIPTGALYYKVDCGTQTSVGTPLCLNGGGPYRITFCKPGNNQNVYRLTPLTKPHAPADLIVSEGCRATLTAVGFEDSTVTWTSLSGSAYNSFLSCRSSCATTTVSPTGSFPSYVDYQVCGRPSFSCSNLTFCDTVRVYFVTTLKVAIEPHNPLLCYNETSTVLKANASGGKPPYKYLWNTGATTSSIVAGPGNYSVKLLDSTICGPVYDSMTVSKVPGQPLAHAGTDTTICDNAVVNLHGSVESVPSGLWIGQGGTFNPSATSLTGIYIPSASEISGGKTTIKLITQGLNGCPEDTDEVFVTIVKRPVPLITGQNPICAGSSNNSYLTGSVPGNNYVWKLNGGTITGGDGTPNIKVTWGFGDTGYISVTETNPTGCFNTSAMKVVLLPKPQPEIAGPDSVCSFTLNSIFNASDLTGSSYYWVVNGGTIASGQGTKIVHVNWADSGVGKITLTEAKGGCDTMVSKTVVINPRPHPAISGPFIVCQNSITTYSTSFSPTDKYLWTVTGGTILSPADQYSISVKWGLAGPGKATVRQWNSFGCDLSTFKNITIMARPLIGIIGDGSVCEKTHHLYRAFDTSDIQSIWNLENGTLLKPGQKKIEVEWNTAGSGIIKLAQISKYGCDTSALKNILVNGKPVPYINGKPEVCSGSEEVYEIGYTSGHQYRWKSVNGQIIGSDSMSFVTVRWSTAATFGELYLREININGCDSVVKAVVKIVGNPSPDISGEKKVCINRAYSYSTPATGGNTYEWNAIGGSVTSGNLNSSATIKWETSGIGKAILKETNPTGCISYDTFLVEIRDFKTTVSKEILYACNPSPVKFSLDATDTLVDIQWQFGDGGTSGEKNPLHIYSADGKFTAKAYTKSVAGCVDTASTALTIFKNPTAHFKINFTNPEKQFFCNEDTVEFENTSSGAFTYKWDFGDGTTSLGFDAAHMYAKPGDYAVKLKIYNETGCEDSAIVMIHIDVRVILDAPSAFTPTGDHLNEYFSLSKYNIESWHVEIYNRWGERVYETDDINFKWDGTFRGDPVQQDVYLFVVRAHDVSGKTVFRKGVITVLR